MARIRTIKPDFFRDEDLQDLERTNPGKQVMLVFAGLWGHCDKEGHFEWKPRTLKLDILPFLDFIMEETLDVLHAHGFVERYTVNGKDYGYVPTFLKHQRISGKEALEPTKLPGKPQGKPRKQRGSTREASEKHQGSQEGNGVQEQEQEGNGDMSPCGDGTDISAEFDVWYVIYPLHKARGQALKAYRAARRIADAQVLILGAERYRDDPNRKPEFTKHPATWLNSQCWLDETTAEPSKSKTMQALDDLERRFEDAPSETNDRTAGDQREDGPPGGGSAGEGVVRFLPARTA